MKRLFVTVMISALALFPSMIYAQDLSDDMQKAVKACSKLSEAVSSDSNTELKAANKELKSCNISNFGNLRLTEGQECPITGHLLFDEVYVDSLIANRAIHKLAMKYASERNNRGAASVKGQILMTTKALKAGAKATWKTSSRGVAEYALIAEPNGLFTLNVKDKDGNRLYTETVNYKKGAAVRKVRIELPGGGKATTLLLEIKNCGKHDASFALLSN